MSGTSRPWKQCHTLPNRYDVSFHDPRGTHLGGILSRMPPRRVFLFSSESMKKREKKRRKTRNLPLDLLAMRRSADADKARMVKGHRIHNTAKLVARLTGERRL